MKFRKWFWGLFFVFAGVLIIISSLGYLGSVNIFTLLGTLILIPIIIESLVHFQFFGVFVPLALICIMFADTLGIKALTPWPILFTAILISIGLQILFHVPHKRWYKNHTTINNIEDNTVDAYVHFGSSVKYINSDDFKEGTFNCEFGALKVYFDKAVVKEKAVITLDISFSGVELYFPKEWNIVNQVDCNLGDISEKNSAIAGGPTVILKGSVSLSGVEIIYI